MRKILLDNLLKNSSFSCRTVSPSTRLSVSPIRPVKSPVMTRKQVTQVTQVTEVLPPWKQAGYVSESSYMASMAARAAQVQTTTQVRMEKRWEGSIAMQQQVSGVAVKEVSRILSLTFLTSEVT